MSEVHDQFAMHPALPRVMCPDCGTHMRLAHIEPHPAAFRSAETTTFECICGCRVSHTLDRVT